METGKVSQADDPSEVHESSSITSDARTQETTGRTSTSDVTDLPCGPNVTGSTKHKLLHVEGASSGVRRLERLAKRTRT